MRNFCSGVNRWIFLSALTCCCSVLGKNNKMFFVYKLRTEKSFSLLTWELSSCSPNHCFDLEQPESPPTLEQSTPQNMLELSTLPSILEQSALRSREVQGWSRAGTLRSLAVEPGKVVELGVVRWLYLLKHPGGFTPRKIHSHRYNHEGQLDRKHPHRLHLNQVHSSRKSDFKH